MAGHGPVVTPSGRPSLPPADGGVTPPLVVRLMTLPHPLLLCNHSHLLITCPFAVLCSCPLTFSAFSTQLKLNSFIST